MGIISNIANVLIRSSDFSETIFIKENSDLQDKYIALDRLNKEYPNNKKIINELFIIKKGLDGENEIAYQLKKSHIGMYVLRDVKVRFEDLTAQIDYVVITPLYIYYIECKNLSGNIIVNEKGDFIRELAINGKKVRKGMYSPLRQVEAQREVIRKIWDMRVSKVLKLISFKNFNYYRRVLVVAANQDTILNTSKAPKEIKNKVLRADNLVRKIEYDLASKDSDDIFYSRKDMEQIANSYLNMSLNEGIDYYVYYKNLYCNDDVTAKSDLKEKLILFRKERSNTMNIPAYYVFTNEELDKIVEARPKNIEKLREEKIMSDIKIKVHGQKIIDIIKEEDKEKS